jgi:hypothetical protein
VAVLEGRSLLKVLTVPGDVEVGDVAVVLPELGTQLHLVVPDTQGGGAQGEDDVGETAIVVRTRKKKKKKDEKR